MVFHAVVASDAVDNARLTMEIVVSEHLSATLPERLAAHAKHGVVIVADPDTRDALGKDTCKRIAEATRGVTKILKDPKATLDTAEALAERLKKARFAIAIGSGTINDLVKYAAHQAGIPYAVIATAPSMNGYTSSTASLQRERFKQSFNAAAPIAVYADLGVLARAPLALRASGMGDTLCRSSVESDWKLAHKLLGTPYDESYFTALRPWEKELLTYPQLVQQGDPGIMRVLFRALLAGGDAMRTHGSSMPASQGEHMIAHTMEYLGHPSLTYHGEEIAVTSMTMARLQYGFLLSDRVRVGRIEPKEELWARFPSNFREAFARKQLSKDALLEKEWEDIRDWISETFVPPITLEAALKKAGCRTSATSIGWVMEEYQNAYKLAYITRDRFTFLDLAVMNGML